MGGYGPDSYFSSGDVTSYNIFSVLPTGGSSTRSSDGGGTWDVLVNMVLTLLLTAFSNRVYHFVSDAWPTWVSNQLKRLFGQREGDCFAVVDVFRSQPEEFAFDSEILVNAIERYISCVLYGEKEPKACGCDKVESDASVERSSLQPSTFLRRARYLYTPRDLPPYGVRIGLRDVLRRYYHLLLLPVDGDVLEVEPGLTVCFHQQWVSTSSLKSGKPISMRGGADALKEYPFVNFDAVPLDSSFEMTDGSGSQSEGVESRGNEKAFGETDDQRDAYFRTKRVILRRALLRCADTTKGHERILNFARRAYSWYVSTIQDVAQRYYYHLSCSELQCALESERLMDFATPQRFPMRRYALPEGRCGFDSLFFPQKNELVTCLDEFKGKRGKFGVPGVAQQLVILLHGAPGTGKTSVTRAIASYLNRSIVAAPIGYFHTNGRLKEFLSSCTAKLPSHDVPFARGKCELSVQKIVYVFEDFDAITKLHSFSLSSTRQNRPSACHCSLTSDTGDGTSCEASPVARGDAGPSGTCPVEPKDTVLSTGSPEYLCDAGAGCLADASATKMRAEGECASECMFDDTNSNSDSGSTNSLCKLRRFQRRLIRDFLSPEGLLQSLDPCLTQPGRVIVLTTNHVNLLPAVLFKPGVLTQNIHLSNWDANTALEFVVRHFGNTLNKGLRQRFEGFFSGCEREGLTIYMNPSLLEQSALECQTAEELLDKMEHRG